MVPAWTQTALLFPEKLKNKSPQGRRRRTNGACDSTNPWQESWESQVSNVLRASRALQTTGFPLLYWANSN